jgi:hypothetical protein
MIESFSIDDPISNPLKDIENKSINHSKFEGGLKWETIKY